MKKIVSLLMVLAIMLTATTAFAAFGTNVTTGLQVSAVEDETGLVTVTVTANTTTNVQGITLYLDLNGVNAVDASTKTALTASTVAADVAKACVVNADAAAQGYKVSAGKYVAGTSYKIVLGGTTAITCANQELCKIYFQKTTDTLADNAFAFGTTTAKNSKISYQGGTQVQTKTAADQQYFGLSITKYEAPIVTNPFSATVDGTTITCAGKVDATVENYGVEFTAKSTVEGARAQKYYGAMPGDTVKDYNGSTTFTFGEWDGTFEIILEGVHAGSKTLSFFANDTIIEGDTTFTLTVE